MNIYGLINKIRLNLGIKRLLLDIKNHIDTYIIYSLYEQIHSYLFKNTVDHYGADYKWGDTKSQNLDKKTKNYGYALIHQALIRNLKPKRLLCIGSMYGYIPYKIAEACEKNKIGHVDFVDANFNIHNSQDRSKHFFGAGFWSKINPNKHFSYLLQNKRISTNIMTSLEFSQKHPNRKYDYIYLDGDHSYEGASIDLYLFWPHLNLEGFICLHDIHFAQNLEGVKFEYHKIWKDLEKMPNKFECSNHYSGLGFIQKIQNTKLPKKISKVAQKSINKLIK